MFWRDVAFLEVLAVFCREVTFLRRCLQCFGGA